MREFHDKRVIRKYLFSWGALAILAVLLFLSLRGLWSVYERFTEARVLRTAAEERLRTLEERKHELEEATAFLQSARGFEAEVRKRFGVVKPGEAVIEIVDAPVQEAPPETKRSLLERFFDLF